MRINVNIDSSVLLRRIRNGEKRMAYAVVNALNATAKKIQQAERDAVTKDFTLRRKEFVLRQAAIIKPFASVGKAIPYVEISVGEKPRLLLSQFEDGGERKPFVGRRVAVPVIGGPARPTFHARIPTAMRFDKLHFTRTRPIGPEPAHGRRKRSRLSGGQAIRFGKQGTYLIPSVGVFQRTGKNSSTLVYAFVAHEQLPKKLVFVEIAKREARTWFGELLEREVVATLARHAGDR